jgi:hypothetical protein
MWASMELEELFGTGHWANTGKQNKSTNQNGSVMIEKQLIYSFAW